MRQVGIEDVGTVAEVAAELKRERVVVLPTDTLYGFSATISSRSAYRRILELKGYGTDRRFIYLAGSIDMVEWFIGTWGCTNRAFLAEIWPAPFSAILPAGDQCPDWIGESIAIRVPNVPPLLAILNELSEPIASTSINRVGELPLDNLEDIERSFGEELDLVVAGETSSDHRPSTLVDFTGEAPVLLRRGGYAWAANGNPSK